MPTKFFAVILAFAALAVTLAFMNEQGTHRMEFTGDPVPSPFVSKRPRPDPLDPDMLPTESYTVEGPNGSATRFYYSDPDSTVGVMGGGGAGGSTAIYSTSGTAGRGGAGAATTPSP